MANAVMLAQEARSKELDRKMETIRWAINKLRSDLAETVGGYGRPNDTSTSPFQATTPSGPSHSITVGYTIGGMPVVAIECDFASGLELLDPKKNWKAETIELVYDNLDEIRGACIKWCRAHGYIWSRDIT